MGNNAVKTIVLLMVLVVLSFVVGAQVSDSLTDSLGAFVIIGCIVGCGVLIYMGRRVWQLLFILPPFIEVIPVSLFDHSILLCSFAPALVGSVVLVYWLILWSMGRAKIRWSGFALLDIPFWIFVVFMVVAFIRHPVALNVMNLDYDSIGGEEVAILIFVIAQYLAFSIIPISKAQLEKCLALSFKLFIVAALMLMVEKLKTGFALGAGRVYAFFPLGSTLLFWAYSKYPATRFIASLRCWLILLFGAAATLVTGQRQNMAFLACGIVFIAIIKREITIFVLSALVAYGGLFLLGEANLLNHMPHEVQRTVSSVPGLNTSKAAVIAGEGTMKTRYRVWAYAMNPATGVIQDYVWGDGFALSRAFIMRQGVAAMRGTGGGTEDDEGMTVTRNFHNGAIHTISRIGYVGFAWCLIMCVIAWVISIQVLRVWWRTETYPYIVLGLLPMPTILMTYGYATFTTKYFLFCLQGYFFLKLCYCIARENGLLRPLFRPAYVPLMIQEAEKAI